MKFITSLSRHRIERQQFCLATWRPYGTITAVQTAEDCAVLAPLFPGVDFVATELTGSDLYAAPNRIRIKVLVDQGPGLLINSDIKLDTSAREFNHDWQPSLRQFNVGVRYDFDGPGKPKEMNPYGIDAFLITEEVMRLLPDVGFVLGVPMWDYWIVWHMMTERFSIETKLTPGLLHLRHVVNWSERDTRIGYSLMDAHYGLDSKRRILREIIPLATGRPAPGRDRNFAG